METERLHAVVLGMVQGVGFRYFVIRTARALGLTGTVINRRDGSVEVKAEGPRGQLEELLTSLHEGPRHGIVQEVRAEWSAATGEFRDFDVSF